MVVVGENWYIHEFGPVAHGASPAGEFPTRNQLGLPDAQRGLLEAIHETGTPTIGVVVAGRPLAIPWMAETLPAILMAYYPGSRGGVAVAETLLGDNDPGGHLPISMPRSAADLPQHFDHLAHPMPLGPNEHPDSYDPLYPFGHGRSYTDFAYDDLTVTPTTAKPDETVEIEVTVENVGDRPGTTVVQAYSSIETSSLVPPVRRLQGFERVSLDPGETRRVVLTSLVRDFGLYEPGVGHRVEPGTYHVAVDEHTATFSVDDA